MLNINTQQPLNMSTLARLYTSGSAEGDSQVQSYLSAQGQRLGIGDPTNYFAQQHQDQYNAAAAAQQRQLEAVRNAPSDPAQLAALQLQQRLAANSLPQAGVATAPGTYLDDQERYKQGFSRDQWAIQKRLGPELSNQLSRGSSQEMLPTGTRPEAFNRSVTADDLLHDEKFNGLMRRRPDLAHQAFEAITGMKHDAYLGLRAADRAHTLASNESITQNLVNKGLNFDDKQGWTMTENDPVTHEPRSRSLTRPELEAVTNGGQGVIPDLHRIATLQGKLRFSNYTQPPVSMPPPQVIRSVPPALQATPGGGEGMGADLIRTGQGMLGDLGRIFSGRGDQYTGLNKQDWKYGNQDYAAPQGRPATHVRALLQNNLRFQQMMREDLERARRIIMAMQTGSQDQSGYPAQILPEMNMQ